jgi:hypothetical protein
VLLKTHEQKNKWRVRSSSTDYSQHHNYNKMYQNNKQETTHQLHLATCNNRLFFLPMPRTIPAALMRVGEWLQEIAYLNIFEHARKNDNEPATICN